MSLANKKIRNLKIVKSAQNLKKKKKTFVVIKNLYH